MLSINQFGLQPGVYQHYKASEPDKGLYVVESIVTHEKNEEGGDWVKLMDPWVVYRNLEPQYEKVNGNLIQVHKAYKRTLSNFMGDAEIDDGSGNKIKVRRFKPV